MSGGGLLLALFFLKRYWAAPVVQTVQIGENRVIAVDQTVEEKVEEKTQPDAEPEGQLESMTLSAFKDQARNALDQLPKQTPKNGITDEEAHHLTPQDLADFEPLVKVVKAVADNPELKKPAFHLFYKKCAADDSRNLAVVIRSRCLSKMRALAPTLGRREEEEVDHLIKTLRNAHPDIVSNSDQIPD